MTTLILTFLVLAAIIVAAGVTLARCGDRIAELTGLGRSLVGMVLLAAATSLPEFTVAWNSVRIGAIDLTIGNVLGASLINLMILAFIDLTSRQRGQMLSHMAAAHALSATASILLTAIVTLFMVLDVDWTLWRLGPGAIAVVTAYVFTLRLVYFDQQYALKMQPPAEVNAARPWWPPVAGFIGAATVVLLAGPRLADTADELAAMTGLGRTFFGTVCVAAITSLPETVTTLEAVRMGARDLAIGNVFGSNAFNMIIPAVGDLASGQPILTVASDTHLITAIAVILVTAVATMGLLYRAEKRYWLIEPDSALVLLLVFGALGLVYCYRP